MSSSKKYYRLVEACNYCRMEVDGSVYTVYEELPNRLLRLIECNKDEKWIKVKTRDNYRSEHKEIDLSNFKNGQTIYLADSNTRWEGGSLDGVPCGYGCFYNEKNELIYTGFVFEGKKICYGMEFYPETSLIQFCGCFYHDKRNGGGQLFNSEGKLIYDGIWYDGLPNDITNINENGKWKIDNIEYTIEDLSLYKFSKDTIHIHDYHDVKRIEVCSCDIVNSVDIHDCNSLEEIDVTMWSCGEYTKRKEEEKKKREEEEKENQSNTNKESGLDGLSFLMDLLSTEKRRENDWDDDDDEDEDDEEEEDDDNDDDDEDNDEFDEFDGNLDFLKDFGRILGNKKKEKKLQKKNKKKMIIEEAINTNEIDTTEEEEEDDDNEIEDEIEDEEIVDENEIEENILPSSQNNSFKVSNCQKLNLLYFKEKSCNNDFSSLELNSILYLIFCYNRLTRIKTD